MLEKSTPTEMLMPLDNLHMLKVLGVFLVEVLHADHPFCMMMIIAMGDMLNMNDPQPIGTVTAVITLLFLALNAPILQLSVILFRFLCSWCTVLLPFRRLILDYISLLGGISSPVC